MFQFAHPIYLYGLIGVPILVFLYVISYRLKKKAIKTFGDWDIMKLLMKDRSTKRQGFKFITLLLAYTAVVLVIAGPQFGSKLEQVKRQGIEIMIALDVSNSMNAEDIQPSRIERSKRAISKMIDKLHNDKIGLIVFAGDAYTQLPITIDYAAAKMFTDAVNTSSIQKQGTAIGTAIDLAISSFDPKSKNSKVIIIITDGENHEDNAVEAATRATEQGIVVHTIGMGSADGAPIPQIARYGQVDYRKDKDGSVIITKLDEVMLQQIASAGEGVYVRASNSETGLNTLYDEINKMKKGDIDAKIYSDYEERFPYLAGIALFLLIIELFILERKNKILSKINIFKINH